MKYLCRMTALAASFLVFAALAIEPPQPTPGAPAKPEPETVDPAPQEPPTPEPAADPAADEEELPPLPTDAEPVGPSPERFNPTEKVRADFPVSFPIDI